MKHVSSVAWTLVFLILLLSLLLAESLKMLTLNYLVPTLSLLYSPTHAQRPSVSSGVLAVDLNWYPPNASQINDLNAVINGTGTYGFIFNSSVTPGNYQTYNWCNMPHVRSQEYPVAAEEYTLEYVELIHRHHKRTPYLANTFPVESYPWYCSDEGLFNYGAPLNPTGDRSSPTYWSLYTSSSNPFFPGGFNGTCQFPQITRDGLDDSYQHGLDLLGVYRDLLSFLPATLDASVSYRVTNNVITSQVASMVIAAMFARSAPYPLSIQSSTIDSLEPTYSCPTASNLYATLGPGSTSPPWLTHLNAAAPLFTTLDTIANISVSNAAFHMSLDHYFDNLSSRLCHSKPLPCELLNGQNTTNCVTPADANEVFRLGEYEYDFLYRSAGTWTLQAAVASYGVYVAELAANIRAAIAGTSSVVYRHNVAHDGSISRLLAILQTEVMVWPGMGAEVVFEVFGKQIEEGKYVRVLWGGQILRSSNPGLGVLDMIPVENLLGYLEGLVGVGSAKIPGLCGL